MTELIQVTQPLYGQIKTAIEKRIRAAEWPADFQVPREEDLAAEFGASALTVRRALRELQSEGMLVRVQGRGTFVVGPRMQCAIFEALRRFGGDLGERRRPHQRSDVACALAPDSPFIGLLALPAGSTVFHSRLLHEGRRHASPDRGPLRQRRRGARLSRAGLHPDHAARLSAAHDRGHLRRQHDPRHPAR